MDHLTLDEIIDFVSLTEINEESMQLLGKVNAHIARCGACREQVRAFQQVYDAVIRTGVRDDVGVKAVWTEGQIAAVCAADLPSDFESEHFVDKGKGL